MTRVQIKEQSDAAVQRVMAKEAGIAPVKAEHQRKLAELQRQHLQETYSSSAQMAASMRG